MTQRLLIRGGFVVSMDPDVGDIPHGEVLVEDGKIVDVGRDLGVTDAETVDASGMIVMPGFIDTHRHTWQTPVRGVLPSCTLDHYFAVMLGQVGGFYRPEDVHIGDWAGSLEAINAGVTTLLDWSHISNTPDHSDAAIQGLKDAGIRAVYAHGMPTGGEWWSYSELNHPEDIRRIRDTYFSSDDGLITLAMAARQPPLYRAPRFPAASDSRSAAATVSAMPSRPEATSTATASKICWSARWLTGPVAPPMSSSDTAADPGSATPRSLTAAMDLSSPATAAGSESSAWPSSLPATSIATGTMTSWSVPISARPTT